MARCFLAGAHLSPDGVLAYSQGKERSAYFPRPGEKQHYVTVHDFDGDGIEHKRDIGVREDLASLLSKSFYRDSRDAIWIGSHPIQTVGNDDALYVIGNSRDSILEVFRTAGTRPEIVIGRRPVHIGVCVWKNLLTSNRIGVRIKVGRNPESKQATKQPHFWDTNVTVEVGAIQDRVSVHPQTFVLPIRNILDGDMID
jgi:hypothetical protein